MKLKVGEWKKEKKRWKLRISETNLLVGEVLFCDESEDEMYVYAFFHDPYNTESHWTLIKFTEDTEKIHQAWEESMNILLKKMFE